MIDLCKLFGVEEGEEFKIGTYYNPYRVYNNSLQCFDSYRERWTESTSTFNYVVSSKVIKLPKKKAFTSDELAIMRSVPKEYRWIARDEIGDVLYLYTQKPVKIGAQWASEGSSYSINIYTHLFQSITSKDEQPVYIPDYVKRQGEE